MEGGSQEREGEEVRSSSMGSGRLRGQGERGAGEMGEKVCVSMNGQDLLHMVIYVTTLLASGCTITRTMMFNC